MKHAVILGSGSDIGRELSDRLRASGWSVSGLGRAELSHYDWWDWGMSENSWDLVVCCYGTLEPIGDFMSTDSAQWENSVYVNTFLPLRQIRELYAHKRPGASVCFFSGAGTSGPAPTYSAYCASKVMLTKMVELLDDESPDCKFFILGPGMVQTKIHEQTLRAGARAANGLLVSAFMDSENNGTSHDDIYSCLMACVAAPKEAVGGRNICVHLDDWGRLGDLTYTDTVFKLRRQGDEALRRMDLVGTARRAREAAERVRKDGKVDPEMLRKPTTR